MYALLRFLPRKLLSRFVGVIVSIPLPSLVLLPILKSFISANKIDSSEFQKPLEEFGSFGEFFVRDLKPESRPIGADIVSPVDGHLSSVQEAQDGTLVQAKSINYTVPELLGTTYFSAGEVYTLYLAPRDYHQVHVPIESRLIERVHIPGTLWPVNDWSISNIPRVFCVNERVVLRLEASFGEYYLVMVGATNVGSMSLSFEDLRTNRQNQQLSRRTFDNMSLAKGDKLGVFNLGSTVILLFPKGATYFLKEGGDLRMGESIGKERV